MRNKQLRILCKRRIHSCELFQSSDQSVRSRRTLSLSRSRSFRPHKHQSSEDSRRDRIPAQLQQLAVTVGILLFHSPLEHCCAARILVFEFGGEFLHIVKGLVFLERRGDGLDGFAFFEEFQFRLSVRIHEDLRHVVADRDSVIPSKYP